jgi:hypothetical protein
MGEDQKVIDLVAEIFGIDALVQDSTKIQSNSNEKGGKAVFIPSPEKENLQTALSHILPDVQFISNPKLASDFGKFSYIHKIKDGRNIYYFANSSDEKIETEVLLKSKMKLEKWNPHSGETLSLKNVSYIEKDGLIFTKCKLNLEPVKSVFWVGCHTNIDIK